MKKEKNKELKEFKEKDSFLLYHNMYDMIADVSDQEIGELIKGVFRYSMYREEPDFEKGSVQRVLFISIKNSIDTNTKKYYEICEKNKRNALKRWRKEQNEIEEQDDEEFLNDYDDEVVIVDGNVCDREEFEEKYADEDVDFDTVLNHQKEQVKYGRIPELLYLYNHNNDNITEEFVKKIIKV